MAQRQWRSDDTDKWKYGFGDGHDGDLVISSNTTDAPIDASCAGTAAATTLSATNASFAAGQTILIHQSRGTGAGNWELNKIDSYTAGTITLKHALTHTYTDSGVSQAQVIVLKQYNSVTVNSGVTWTAKAWNGDVGGILGFMCKGVVTVTGTISAVGKGFRINSQYYNSNSGQTIQGEGTGGAGGQSLSANGNGPGGGGGTISSGGQGSGSGSGGSLTAGSNGYNNGYSTAAGGAAVGTSDAKNTNLGGGSGGRISGSAVDTGSDGTAGSGLVFFWGKKITVSSLIDCKTNNTSTSGYTSGAGGAGRIFMAGIEINLGTNKLNTTGGTGRTGKGGDGNTVVLYSKSFSGTATASTINAIQDATIKVGSIAPQLALMAAMT